MTQQELFAANLRRLIDSSALSKRQVADRAGVSYTTLCRWLENGVREPDRRTKKPLQKICRMLHVGLDDLWTDRAPPGSAVYPQKVHELYLRWERLGTDGREFSELLERWCTAACVAEKFRHDEPDLAEVVGTVKGLKNQGEVQAYLEGLLRDWQLDEANACRRLVEITQRFLAASLPVEPEQLGRWFREVHPQRWAGLLKTGKLDNEGELVAFVRHMMAEGLSPLEAYEGLLRLSNGLPVDTGRPSKI
jgi:transcriptional regulator with XRE-family HTH domain